VAQISRCGEAPCEYYIQREQRLRDFEMTLMENEMRQKELEQRQRLDDMERRMRNLESYPSSNPYPPYPR
jgi:hypothetical protein